MSLDEGFRTYAHAAKMYGYDADWADVEDLLQEVLKEGWPLFNTEDLLIRPTEALHYCAAMRRRTKCEAFPDHFILSALINLRKRGKLE